MKHDAPSIAEYLSAIIDQHGLNQSEPLVPEVKAFEDLVLQDPLLRQGFATSVRDAYQISLEAGANRPKLRGGPRRQYPTTFAELVALLSKVVSGEPPAFTSAQDPMVGFPILAIVQWMMYTDDGYVLFRDPRVNKALKSILNAYGAFLDSNSSTQYLHNGTRGWFSTKKINFSEYVHDPAKPHWGWTSWNDFFARQFVEGARPVEQPQNSKVIVSSCEAKPSEIANGVKLTDQFWVKSQQYSLLDIFTYDKADLALKFDGGSVYEAFLSAFNYHRWHSPIKGTVRDLYTVNGTYYSQAKYVGPDPTKDDNYGAYLVAVASRMIFVIEADDPALGLVTVVQVGMSECSSVHSTVRVGQKVEKGQEIGMFKFGGSTFLNIFQKGVIRNFTVGSSAQEEVVQVNRQIAWAN
jgi:phosphatidylserine decarboxylase